MEESRNSLSNLEKKIQGMQKKILQSQDGADPELRRAAEGSLSIMKKRLDGFLEMLKKRNEELKKEFEEKENK